MRKQVQTWLGALCFGALMIAPDINPADYIKGPLSGAAQARAGRTPAGVGSVGVGTAGHGVARRTTRRAVAATGAYVNTVPYGCPIVQVNGKNLYYCGGVYYQASAGGYAVVVVN